MRKIFTSIKAMVTSVVVMAVVAGSVSCTYDDTAVWKEINQIKKEIEQLRTDLDNVLSIVSALENGDLGIREVKLNADGSKTVTLSNGSKFTVYPQGGGYSDVVTTVYVDGVRYWAMYDGLGSAQPILVNGEMIPVADLVPMTQINDGAIEVSFDGGKTWVLTGYAESITDTIITNVEVVYSDWQTDADGNPVGLYCVVTFADGTTMNVGMQNGKLVLGYDSMFVSYGNTGTFYFRLQDAVDYIAQIPEGWECEIEHKAKQELMTLTVTAPTLEAIDAGKAVASGVAKIMVVFNNGSSAIARLMLSTNPATVEFASEGIYIEAGSGASRLIGGLLSKNTNFDNVLPIANNHLAGTTSSYVYDMSFIEVNKLYIPYTDLLSSLTGGNEYYFWYAAPNLGEDGVEYIEMKDVFFAYYKHVAPTLKVTKTGFFDLDVTLKVAGADENHEYMIGFCPAEEFDAEYLAAYYTDYNDYFYANHAETEYKGSFLALVDPNRSKLDPDTDYVMWYINETSLPNIRVDNVLSWDLKTAAFAEGGSVAVAVSDVVVEYTSINMTLNSNGHIAMYYALVPDYEATAYPTDTLAIDMLTRDGGHTYSDEAVKVEFTGAAAGTKLVLFAVAVDANGKYGKVLKQEYTTKEFVYNDLALALNLVDYKIDNTRVEVACEGAAKYVYVYAPLKSSEWTEIYGGTKKKIGEYMIANEGNSRICDTSLDKYALVEGAICISNLEMGVEYGLVVMAVDAEGGYSKPEAIYFTPIANIGDVVKRADANWEEGKPSIKVIEYDHNPHLFTMFSWEFIPGPHTRAYSAAMWPANFVNEDLGTNVDTVEKLIAELISSCDTGTMSEAGISAEWQESGIYVREWTEWEDTDGDGYLEEVFKTEDREGAFHFFPYGSEGQSFIYTTWVGEDGNFHEPFAINPKTGKEVDIWTGADL